MNLSAAIHGYSTEGQFGRRLTSEGCAAMGRHCWRLANTYHENKYTVWFWYSRAAAWFKRAAELRQAGL